MSISHRLREQAISRKSENTGFTCARCGTRAHPLSTGSYRNHCPSCLWSRHVDDRPGDRRAVCGGLMAPVAIDQRSGKGLVVVQCCVLCGHVRPNRLATDDLRQPDDIAAIAALSAARPPGERSRGR